MAHPKSPDQAFTSDWNKAVAWASSQGIPTASYIPVYQLDLQRLSSYGQPMSVAERSRAIIAANNPNQVTSAPTDNPNPSNVLGNTKRDLGMIFTGLLPTKLVPTLFDTTKNTVEDILDPHRAQGPNTGTTVANWLQNTLLSFVPGAYDVGTVLRADPTLSGDAGFKALAKDPLISALDLLPAGSAKVLTGALSKTDLGAAMAAKLNMTPQQFAGSPLHTLLSHIHTGQIKALPGGGDVGNLTAGQWITDRLQNSAFNTSGPVQQLAKAWFMNDQHFSGIQQTLIQEPIDAVSSLDETQKAQFNEIILRNQRDRTNIQTLLDDRKVSPPVRHAVVEFMNGPLRFAQEEAFAAEEIAPVRRPDGTMGMYSSTQDPKVLSSLQALTGTHKDLLGQLEPADALVKQNDRLEATRPKLADALEKSLQGARQATETDPALLENATEQIRVPGKKKPELKNYGAKREMARKLFGPDGMVDLAIKAAREGKNDTLTEVTKILESRLSKWGEYSVDAGVNPAFQAVLQQVRMMKEIARRQDHLTKEINRRIKGNAARVSRETVLKREERATQWEDLKARQAVDRANHTSARRQELALIDTSYRFKVDQYDRLYEQMKEAALVKGDHATERATKEQADATYQVVRREIRSLALSRNERVTKAKRDAETATVEAKARWNKTRSELKKLHDAQKAQLRDEQDVQKQYDGELMHTARAHLKALRDFHRAVYDHPTDNYRDMRAVVYQKHLLEGLHNAEIIDATEKDLMKSIGNESRVQTLMRDPARLRELVSVFVGDVFDNPGNFDPRLVEHVTTAKKEATQSAIDEINRLAAEGYHPEWIPAVGPFDTPRPGVRTTVGPVHVDVGFRRTNEVVNTRYDVVAGAVKSVTQRLRRDAAIHFLEHDLSDIVLTGDNLRHRLNEFGVAETFDPNAETLSHAYSKTLEELGLTRFYPERVFGYSLPRWEGKALFLPTGLATALEKLEAVSRKGEFGAYDKATTLFRFSILGLSPRYTAHITFGGGLMLALRSTPYIPVMLARAARAMKEGTAPLEVATRPSEEGFQRLSLGLQEHAKESGKNLGHLAIQERLEQVQGVLLSKASPFHYLKAAAELNHRFTHYVNILYRTAAYLDYSSRAERRGTFIDEVTGQEVPMTKERAREEGMHHAVAVFGDLRSMSPVERQIARRIFPFYGWSRHILRYVLSYPFDHPWRAMVLSLMAFENSQNVPAGLPERIQFLFFLGSPDSQGNVKALDTRYMDPFRDTANYFSMQGLFQSLNPALLAPFAMTNPQIVYGSNQLYPNLTFNQMYGISTAGAQGSALTGLEQFVPQLGALATGGGALVSAITNAKQYRSLAQTNPNAFYKQLFNSLNIPMAQVQSINVKQIAAKDEIARYGVAKAAAQTAFQTGNFGALAGYSNVPNPLNPDYDITVPELEAVYNAALAQYPGQSPVDVITPPPPPPGL